MMTLTAYAARRGVSVKAVSKAVASGRLASSIVRDKHGAPKIADPEVADREWQENTRSSIDRPPLVPVPEGEHEECAPAPRPDDVPDYHESRARREAAAARREAALAELAERELAVHKGTLIDAAQARADVIGIFTIVKTRLLGIPSRVAQRLPHLAAEVVPLLDELLREALEDLADGRGAADEADADAESEAT